MMAACVLMVVGFLERRSSWKRRNGTQNCKQEKKPQAAILYCTSIAQKMRYFHDYTMAKIDMIDDSMTALT
jgi:hypothetical protein